MNDTAMRTRVVHVSDNVPGAVYIGRAVPRKGLKASPYANPFKLGDGATRTEVIARYRYWAATFVTRDALRFLVGKPLACWCRHDGEERTEANACHGDVLVELIRELGLEDPPEEKPRLMTTHGSMTVESFLASVAKRSKRDVEVPR